MFKSIVISIVSYNKKDLLKKCIESILQNTEYPNYKIAVVCNGCTDGSVEMMEDFSNVYKDKILFFYNEKNEFFVKPNNFVINSFPNSDIVLVNNDIEVTDGWLNYLYDAVYEDDKIGAGGGKILNYDNLITSAGGWLYKDEQGLHEGIWGYGDRSDTPIFNNKRYVNYVPGCLLYMKREAINKIGALDEDFHPMYYEETAWQCKLYENGYRVVYESKCVAYHIGAATASTSEECKQYIKINREKFISKFFNNEIKKPMVYDCFIFFNELDLLEARLNILNDVVDKFVLVEATKTFTNKDKSLYYKENQSRFEKFNDKIIHVVIDYFPEWNGDPWEYEKFQRFAINHGLWECGDEDILVFSDLDEIPNPNIFKGLHNINDDVVSLEMNFYYYFMNCMSGVKWYNAKVLKYRTFLNRSGRAVQKVRMELNDRIINNAGWHFSYLGGIESIINKLESFSHQELNTEDIKNKDRLAKILEQGLDLFGRDIKYNFVDVDDTYPKYIKNNIEWFKDKGWIYEIKKKKFSVVIPTYNHLEDCLKPCLESIIKHTKLDDNIEILVIANGCTDGTVEYVNSLNIPQIKVFEYKEALGYTVATNNGIKLSCGDYVILMNNDLVLLDWQDVNWVDMLYAPFAQDDKIGITGSVRMHHKTINRNFLLFYSVMIKRQMFDIVGLLDEAFNPGAGEDTDFCIKVEDAGYRCVQVPYDNMELVQNGDVIGCYFPIYHPGSVTTHELSNWNEVVKRNDDLLVQRYGKKYKNIGLLTVRNEVDVIDEFMDNIEKYFDEVVVMDDSDDGTYEKIKNRKSIKYIVKFEDVYDKNSKRTDGHKEHLYRYIMDKYGDDNVWITVLNADAFMMDDPNKTIEYAESVDANMVGWWVYNFAPSMQDKKDYEADKEAWMSTLVQKRLQYLEDIPRMEYMQFKASKDYYYDINKHGSIVPEFFTNNFHLIRFANIAPTLFHYPHRSPKQIWNRAKDRATTGFRNFDFYYPFFEGGGFVDKLEGQDLVHVSNVNIECYGFGLKNVARFKLWGLGELSKNGSK